ncbi:MAG: universal stress protein [Nitrososphaerota archaeon]|nr:universal stress protein [Candidatus Calditenuaceae archaeon]MDW8073321.1 universal stress protein [Nitrososphaerota archaeon]
MLATEQEKALQIRNSRRILVYVDGSNEDQKVIDAASKMAMEEGAELVIMTTVKRVRYIPDDFIRFVNSERIVDPPQFLYYKYVGEALLAPYTEMLKAMGVPFQVQIEVGDKRERIEAVAKSLKPYRLVLSLRDLRDRGFSATRLLRAEKTLDLECPITLIP